jgi:hypothetical protein
MRTLASSDSGDGVLGLQRVVGGSIMRVDLL